MSKLDAPDFDMKDGISLLGLKHHVMLSHLQGLTLLSCRRVLGESLSERAPPADKFSEPERSARGDGAGDVVDTLVENRVVLEKIKILENRMKYQIEKLVRLAEQANDKTRSADDLVDDPLAFRPNPANLVVPQSDDERNASDDDYDRSGVYRPPKVAPVPYLESSGKDKKEKRARVPAALAAVGRIDGSAPLLESTTGIGAKATFDSARARELEHMARFEEDNMTRLVLPKRDARRRKADEEHIALGGRGPAVGKRRGGGLEDDFADLLKAPSSSRRHSYSAGDGYEELRERGKKQSLLERARARKDASIDLGSSEGAKRKRSRFERDVKGSKKRRM
ncbi:hypothetical protein EXIGLDRAFT_726175 [Exidia glandulosa HHB12029]|uniref:Neuroguidin n=1 Tax=Exidia glandulosa HHB12029 TaxID=1314781 RepID=A0A165MCV4_EXIGL|nr:hypothetical protein EXIGLDRAFT_726175 [Exidia glandulosa HHB12029]